MEFARLGPGEIAYHQAAILKLTKPERTAMQHCLMALAILLLASLASLRTTMPHWPEQQGFVAKLSSIDNSGGRRSYFVARFV